MTCKTEKEESTEKGLKVNRKSNASMILDKTFNYLTVDE